MPPPGIRLSPQFSGLPPRPIAVALAPESRAHFFSMLWFQLQFRLLLPAVRRRMTSVNLAIATREPRRIE